MTVQKPQNPPKVAAKSIEIEQKFGLRLGQLPSPIELIPTTFTGMALVSTAAIAGAALSYNFLNISVTKAVIIAAITALSALLIQSFETAQQRRGCVLNESEFIIEEAWETKKEAPNNKNIDIETTQAIQKATGNNSLFTRIKYSSQFRLLIIANDNPYSLGTNKVMGAMAINTGTDLDEIKFIPVIEKGKSAFLIPRPQKEWNDEPIPYTKAFHKKNDLMGYIGQSVFSKPILYSRKDIPHALFAGQTGSGKTEAVRVDIQSMLDSDTHPIIHVFDPKADMADIATLIAKTGGSYTDDIKTGIELLETLANEAVARKKRYSQQGQKNIWAYRDNCSKTDKDSRPVFIYVDEIALVMKGIKSENKTYTDPDTQEQIIGWKDRAAEVIGDITRRDRAAGLFFTGGIQRPDAKIIDGEFKSNIGLVVALSHINAVSSQVTIDSNIAAGLPLKGGMAIRMAGRKKIIIGRGAYLD